MCTTAELDINFRQGEELNMADKTFQIGQNLQNDIFGKGIIIFELGPVP